MHPQVDEITNARHLKMSFMEFLEAISRAIDRCKDLPIQQHDNEHWWIKENLEISKWLLDMKLEAMLPNMLKLIKFQQPPASESPVVFNKTANQTTRLSEGFVLNSL